MTDTKLSSVIDSSVETENVIAALGAVIGELAPTDWDAIQLVIPGTTIAARLQHPDGRACDVKPPRALRTLMKELLVLRRRTSARWRIATITVRRIAGGWQTSTGYEGGDRPSVVAGLPASFPPRKSSRLPSSLRDKIEAFVIRAETAVATGDAAAGLAALASAFEALRALKITGPETGWICYRAAGLHLGLGDAQSAATFAGRALACGGWTDDARALLRLGQARHALGEHDKARAALARAAELGGAEWFRSVAPELVRFIRA